MAGRIRDDDIALVRERTRIDEVVSQYVTLRPAGAGSMKGLCPFHDEKSPSFNVRPQLGAFHCLAGETEVLTWDGPRPIRGLAGGVHRVLGRHADWVEAPFRSYGVQRLFKITLTRNQQVKELYATDGHRWFVRSGKTLQSTREALTTDLRPGHRLAYVYPRSRIRQTTPSPFGIAHGITYGDGTLNGTGAMAKLCPPKDHELLKWFPNSYVSADGDNLLVHHLPRFFKSLPSLDESVPYLYGWLAGYFAADGCVAKDGTVMVNSAKRENLEFVRTVCTRLGIGTYGITMQMREGFPGREPSALYRVHLVNDDLTDEFFLLDEHRRRFQSTHKEYVRRGWVVRSVEPTDRVEEVFCAEVEDGHAFALADNILTSNCFGCAEGGDAISFLQKIEGLGFVEAVERLAAQAGITLRYEDGGRPERKEHGSRARLIEAHKAAADYYAEQLHDSPDAAAGRTFLSERGFDKAAAETFGIGFAPRGPGALLSHLRGRGFADEELVTSGLVATGARGRYDRFRGRLVWPIRELAGDVVGFGARRLFDDDRVEAKYLNTPETPIYHKSQVLYGVDLARREIARRQQAVVVEGYTDVMACHLAGVPTAVATCGTAFGEDHGRVLRRLLLDHDEFRGEVIFTFDGDEAGQRAAMRAFDGDQQFVSQTYVAVEASGMDPCDLRLAHGDAAVRDLIARRVPLYRFVLGNVLRRYDLDRADGRIDALRATAPLFRSVRDKAKAGAYARELAGLLGLEVEEVRAEVGRAMGAGENDGRKGQGRGTARVRGAAPPERPNVPATPLPDRDDLRLTVERELLKLVMQSPTLAGPAFDSLEDEVFTHPGYVAVRHAMAAAGGAGTSAGGDAWVAGVGDKAVDDGVRALVTALAVEPLRATAGPDQRYASSLLARVQELAAARQIADVKSRLQRMNPVEQTEAYNKLFGELVALEQHRRALRDRAIGGLD
ncbi:DNA primase [Actinopolymorpha sp. B9G3]|uniref:DNA primase n=1 Tax=Actinopolymorpha sp. B9G3 TaxID=3158970 RepID=UPI0032D97635